MVGIRAFLAQHGPARLRSNTLYTPFARISITGGVLAAEALALFRA